MERSLGRFALVLLFCFVSSLAAQRRWVVDSSNRPGTHFTDIPTAVAVAGSGDTLVVRVHPNGWSYVGAAWSDKNLIIVGEGGRPVASGFEVTFTQGGGELRISAMSVGDTTVRGGSCLATDCDGRHLALVGSLGVLSRCEFWGGSLYVSGSSPQPLPGLELSGGSAATVDHCAFRGGSISSGGCPGYLRSANPVVATDSTLAIHDCDVEAGSSASYDINCSGGSAGLSAITLTRSTLSVSGDHKCRIAGGNFSSWNGAFYCPGGQPIFADQQSFVSIHGNVQLQYYWSSRPIPLFPGIRCSTDPIVGSFDQEPRSLPRIAIDGAGAGGRIVAGQPIRITVLGEAVRPVAFANSLVALGWSVSPAYGPPLSASTIGPVWLPQQDFAYSYFLDASGMLRLEFPGSVPPAVVGISFFAQAAVFAPGGYEIRMSNVEGRMFP